MMSAEPRSADLTRLLRWDAAGGTWQVLSRRGGAVTVSLCRCDGGEEVDRLVSDASDLVGYVLGAAEPPALGTFAEIDAALRADPANAWADQLGYEPLYVAGPAARIAVIGQAPGRKAQESGLAWNDVSGVTLRDWLGVSEETFRDPAAFAILPMDFYYPGKGARGDLPPRRDFAPRWHPPLLALMPRIRLTLLVGAYAQRHYLGTGESVTAHVLRYRDYLPGVLPLVHPSPLTMRWRARNPWFGEQLLPQLRRVVADVLAE